MTISLGRAFFAEIFAIFKKLIGKWILIVHAWEDTIIVEIIKAFAKEGIELLKHKNRPALSILLYLFSGMLALLSGISLISPFHINVGFLDNIAWKGSIGNDDLSIMITFEIIVIYFVFKIFKIAIIRYYQEKANSELRMIYARVYTIEDILDLLCAILCLFFMLSVFIQIYYAKILFISYKACLVYVLILSKDLNFCYRHFHVKNLRIIDNALSEYNDMG